MNRLLLHLRGKFLAGLFVVIPIGITIFIMMFLFSFADGILGPYLAALIAAISRRDTYVPGMGMVTGAVIIYLTGLVATNVIGVRLFRWWEGVLVRIPLVKPIYTSSKQLIQVFREGWWCRGAVMRALRYSPDRSAGCTVGGAGPAVFRPFSG